MGVFTPRLVLLVGALLAVPVPARAHEAQERRAVYAAVLDQFARRHPNRRYDLLMVRAASVTGGWGTPRQPRAVPEPGAGEAGQRKVFAPTQKETQRGSRQDVMLPLLDRANERQVDLRADLEGLHGVLVDAPGVGWPLVARVARRATLCCGCCLCAACPPVGVPVFMLNQLALLPFQTPAWLAAVGVGSRRHVALSNVGFNDEKNMAAVFVELDTGFEPSGHLVILKRAADGRWELAESQMVWIV